MAQQLERLQSDVKAGLADVKSAMNDAATFVSPTGQQYEADADKDIDGLLERNCGLRIIATVGPRSIPATAPESGKIQWDGRFFVTFCEKALPAISSCTVYGGGEYKRPISVQLRSLSPTKAAKAQYFAVFEYTLYYDWYADVRIVSGGSTRTRDSLLPRLEKRLNLCMRRYNDTPGNAYTDDVLQVVAVVGVVSQSGHVQTVGDILASGDNSLKLLKTMYKHHRFVHFQKASMIPQAAPMQLAPSLSAAAGE